MWQGGNQGRGSIIDCVSTNKEVNFICLAVSGTETEPSSGAISVQPKGESNPLLQKVATTALQVSPRLAVALSFCLPIPSSLHTPVPPIQQVMAESNGVTSQRQQKNADCGELL